MFSRLLKQQEWEATSVKKIPLNPPLLKGEGIQSLQTKLSEQTGKLCGPELVNEVMRGYGVETTQEYLVTDAEQISEVFAQFSSSHVVAKISSPDIAHKTDVGGIITDISTLQQAQEAYENILQSVTQAEPDAKIEGVIFQNQVPKSQEIFVGLKRDPSF